MKRRLMHWLLPLIVILAITTIMVLNVSLGIAHAAPGSIIPDSFWRG